MSSEDALAPGGPPSSRDDVDDAAPSPPPVSPAPVMPAAAPLTPACYFVVHNISKKHNVGTIARCATAFGVAQVVLIGSKSYNTFGCKGSSAFVDFAHYPTLGDARRGLMAPPRNVTKILGVEICPDAVPIETHPFDGPCAFICGNEGEGMTEQQKAICDGFVYVRQHGPGTASLNVAVTASIVMHHYSMWAKYPERERAGEKYVVGERPQRTHKRGTVGEDPEAVRARRAKKREEAARAEEEEAEAGGRETT